MMDWVWLLYENYLRKELARTGSPDPDDETLQATFISALGDSYVTLLVQEPWRGSVRFKTLARFDSATMFDLLNDPMGFLAENYGGGKFKLNFHHGYHFVETRNFKPQGEPRWTHLPELTV